MTRASVYSTSKGRVYTLYRYLYTQTVLTLNVISATTRTDSVSSHETPSRMPTKSSLQLADSDWNGGLEDDFNPKSKKQSTQISKDLSDIVTYIQVSQHVVTGRVVVHFMQTFQWWQKSSILVRMEAYLHMYTCEYELLGRSFWSAQYWWEDTLECPHPCPGFSFHHSEPVENHSNNCVLVCHFPFIHRRSSFTVPPRLVPAVRYGTVTNDRWPARYRAP